MNRQRHETSERTNAGFAATRAARTTNPRRRSVRCAIAAALAGFALAAVAPAGALAQPVPGPQASAAGRPAAAQESPDQLIERVGTEIIERIRSDEAIRAGNVEKLSQLVDELVLPYVNFERMTALSAGRWWRQATPEQRQRLMDEFRAMLLRTYSGAMSAVGDQTIRMKPLRAEPGAKDLIVRSEIVQPGREPIQLDYRMQNTDSGWKIYDLNVLGVWIVETYRNQFNQEAQRGGGVEGLIRSLADKNREFGPKKAS